MKQNHSAIRVFGQRSIAPSFFDRSSNSREDSEDDSQKRKPKKDSSVSLSDFLDLRLNKTPVLYRPTTVRERSRPFTPFAGTKDETKSSDGRTMNKQGREEDKSDVPAKAMFEQFKQRMEGEKNSNLDKVIFQLFKKATVEAKDDKSTRSANKEQIAGMEEDQGSRKRKNPFEGVDVEERTRKAVLVLGDKLKGPNPSKKQRVQIYDSSSKKYRPAYNHYANGSGWWDCDMEGVDSEEVGYGEVWEGVGSTTFGEIIDWH